MSMIEQMMVEMAKKSGLDLSKIEKPSMKGNNLEIKVTEAQLQDMIQGKDPRMKDNIGVKIESGLVTILIKIA